MVLVLRATTHEAIPVNNTKASSKVSHNSPLIIDTEQRDSSLHRRVSVMSMMKLAVPYTQYQVIDFN